MTLSQQILIPQEDTSNDLMDEFRSVWARATPRQRERIAMLVSEITVEKPGDCPHKRIIALYHEILPSLRGIRVYTSTRQSHVRARWKDMPSLEEWRAYFELVARCPHLMGKGSEYNGRVWQADFDWLINQNNWAKVIEGKYLR